MMEALDQTTEMSERMQPYRKLYNILTVFIPTFAEWLRPPPPAKLGGKAGDVDVIFQKSQKVRSTITEDMLVAAKKVPVAAAELIDAFEALVGIVNGSAVRPLESITVWGQSLRNLDCLFRKAPDHSNRLVMLSSMLSDAFDQLSSVGRADLQASLDVLGRQPFDELPARPTASCRSASVPAAAARRLFPTLDFLCAAVQDALIGLVDAFAAVTLVISESANVLSAVVEPSPLISQTNLDQSR